MPEKTKQEENQASDEKNEAKNALKNDKTGTWGEDQKEKSYYYDDSYGYEIYNPDEDDQENE